MTALGLTWDHPRGRDALVEIARRANEGRPHPLIEWGAQPLEGFESAPIAELAATRDLLVLDHPHIGEAVAERCLIPLDDLYSADQIQKWREQSIGAAMTSYMWEGKAWALPLDVASQVMARNPEVLPKAPETLSELVALSRNVPVALSLAGPHALLTLFSLAAASGHLAGGPLLLPDQVTHGALTVMQELWNARPLGSEALNPIGLLEAISHGDIALCPLIFGYVTYASQAEGRVAFSNPLSAGAGGVLGGTGLAFTTTSRPTDELLAHVASLMDRATQTRLIPEFGGQPSAREAWQSEAVNARWGHFYADTSASVERAFIRPRFDGYVAFQTEASARLRAALAMGEEPATTLTALRNLWRTARARARGALDDERELTL